MQNNHRSIRIINVPLDLGASCRGAGLGPAALRQAGLSQALVQQRHYLDSEINLPVSVHCRSLAGEDLRVKFKSEIRRVCEHLARITRDTMREGHLPLVIGGDHSIAMGSVAGIASYYHITHQSIGLLWVDAHADMNVPETSPSGNLHGMPLAHLLGYGDPGLATISRARPAVNPRNVVIIGARDIDEYEHEIIRQSGVTVITMRDIRERGMRHVAARALEQVNAGTAGFHLSFDVDGCDPSVIPGTGIRVPGGISLQEGHELFRKCSESGRLVSMDVAELNPRLDPSDRSAQAVVSLVQTAFQANRSRPYCISSLPEAS